jgi:pimeloyl-ACP methyl ester carboxylesterase
MSVKSFAINVPNEVLDDLQERLSRTRWTDEVDGSDWGMGTSLGYMKDLVSYWQSKYNWRKHEAEFNKLNHFKANVDGIELHFIHQKSKNPKAIPLLLIHGWPDSFYRFHKVIPLLSETFDVIVPSLPGFGFSERKAMSAEATADLLAKLMTDELGYHQFVAAGGDIGTNIVQALARKHSDTVTAIHLTDAGFPNGSEDFSTMTPAEQQFAGKCQQWWYMEGAYNALQSTKPQTIGFGLSDSPVGLAAWIVEKFYAWSDNKGDIEKSFTKDELLTNIMIYWVTETITSSMRTYLENTRALYAQGPPKPAPRSDVPAAIASFPAENVPLPREWAERSVNVQRFTTMQRGGHFGAWEEPELYTKDIQKFIAELEVNR